MSEDSTVARRQFLRRGLAAVGAALAAPLVVPAKALGRGGAVAPSDQIILGAMGIGGRGGYVFGCMLREPARDGGCANLGLRLASCYSAVHGPAPCQVRG